MATSTEDAQRPPSLITEDKELNRRNSHSLSPADSAEKHEETEFKPGYRFYLAFLTLAVLTLMVALDGTSLSVALPVSTDEP